MRLSPALPDASPATREAAAQIVRSRGKISPLYQLLLHSPAVASGWESLLTAIRSRCSLSPLLRELIILRIAVLNKAPYEFHAHVPFAHAAGLSDEKIQAVRLDDRTPFDGLEALALDYCDVMTQHIHVPDELFARVRHEFDDTALIELTATIAAYNMVSRFLEALHVR